MKKSTVIFIAIIYLSSIAIISFFGMKIAVYNEIIPVTAIECINETDENVEVTYSDDKKILKVPFTEPANIEEISGTMIQIQFRVLPDNASEKEVKFVYSENERVYFYKNENGEETGLVLFSGKANIRVTIMSTDGRRVMTEITLWAY